MDEPGDFVIIRPHDKKFVKGIRNDYDALVNGILLKASNGKIEGKINKLKKIKRDMYGRCSFGLLKGFFFGLKINPFEQEPLLFNHLYQK
jgi:hypothetical protein